MIPLPSNVTAYELRAFARFWFPLLILVAGSTLRWRFGDPLAANVVWVGGSAIAVAALARPRIARFVFVGILTAVYPIGVVTSTIARSTNGS